MRTSTKQLALSPIENGWDVLTASSHVRRTVRGEEDGKVVELVNVSETLLRGVVNPDPLLSVKGGDTVQCGVHVTRRDGVDTDAVAGPLGGERAGELNDSGLGGVVARLLLRVVDDRSGHRGDEYHRNWVLDLNHLLGDSLSDQESSSDVDVDETTEHLGGVGVGRNVRALSNSVSWMLLDEGDPTYSAIPAELRRTSIFPKCSTTSLTAFLIAASSLTSTL